VEAPAIRPTPEGAVLEVRVSPGAKRGRILGLHGEALKVAVQAPPERGRANRAVQELLAGACGAKASDVAVVRGGTARQKAVLFRGWDADRLRKKIEAILVTLGRS
jgi:uncharacterized protein (TIGR00251 family)